ncbi:M20/M25/M40 family metallo-hydrolase [Oerskovia merdavium]|uniref:M20/M25/M40 family metallo-hydrolase n=1 Tax=Oerskovia merdavium TaxID=2762227 RepID=UPI00296AF02E|nr:M20/M25/M40 family metallo-hydrolase [Oerskovia merdavium]
MRTRPIVPSVAALSLGLAAVFVPPAAAAPPAPPAPLEDHVSGAAVMQHLEQLQAIADANGGNRAIETPGYEASAAYVEQVLTDAGYTPERQYFSFDDLNVDELSLTAAGVAVTADVYPAEFAPDTPAGGVTGPLVQPVDALKHGCTAEDWAGVQATGGVALISRGTCAFGLKVQLAAEAGASAVIIYNNTIGAINPTLGAPSDDWVPAVGIPQAAGQAILAALAGGPADATYVLQTSIVSHTTFNILAETSTGRADNVVMLGAHLDGVPEGPGINDNGSGSAAILETAVQLAEHGGPLDNQVRFAWWGAEEVGLVGSTHYVDDLVANDPTTLDQIATYLNFDMVGSPNYVIGVYDADESTYPAPVEVPPGSPETEDVFTDYFDSIGQAWVDSEFSGRSDYQAFIANGVPASGLFTGADDIKTDAEVALFGGTAGIWQDPNYHSVNDDIENIDPVALDINAKAIAHATASLAADTSAINGVVSPVDPELTGLTATARCTGKVATLSVVAINGEDRPLDVLFTTPFGTKTFNHVNPDKNVHQSFSARSGSLPAGSVTVKAWDDAGSQETYTVDYAALTC